MPGDRRCLVRDALHQIAVAAEDVDVVVEELESRPVEVRGLPHRRSPSLRTSCPCPERTGRPTRPLMSSGTRGDRRPSNPELPEGLDVVEGHRLAYEHLVIRDPPPSHRRPGGAASRATSRRGLRRARSGHGRPDQVLRVEAQEALPEGVGSGSRRHRGAGVPGVRLLDRIDRECPDGVDAEGVSIAALEATACSILSIVNARCSGLLSRL